MSGDGKSYYIPKKDIDDAVKVAKKEGKRIIAAYVRDSMSKYYKCKINKNAEWINK